MRALQIAAMVRNRRSVRAPPGLTAWARGTALFARLSEAAMRTTYWYWLPQPVPCAMAGGMR